MGQCRNRQGPSTIAYTADKAVLARDCRAQSRPASRRSPGLEMAFSSIPLKLLDRRYSSFCLLDLSALRPVLLAPPLALSSVSALLVSPTG
jgi:hypothetical protein